MDSSMMAEPYRYSFRRLMDTGAFSVENPKKGAPAHLTSPKASTTVSLMFTALVLLFLFGMVLEFIRENG